MKKMMGIKHVRALNKYFKSDYSAAFKASLKNDCIEIDFVNDDEFKNEVVLSYDLDYGDYVINELNNDRIMPFCFLEGIMNVLKEVDGK